MSLCGRRAGSQRRNEMGFNVRLDAPDEELLVAPREALLEQRVLRGGESQPFRPVVGDPLAAVGLQQFREVLQVEALRYQIPGTHTETVRVAKSSSILRPVVSRALMPISGQLLSG